MADKIRGPLGIWPFPILNTIIQVSKIRNSSSQKNVRVVRASELDEGDRMLEFLE